MFPTAHDITPALLRPAIAAIKDLLAWDNEVLIVSKPHLHCIEKLCTELKGFEHKILFRFTIGTLNKRLAKFWEPGAPEPIERLACLKLAKEAGFRTSVSMEPMLAGIEETISTFRRLLPWATETIWIGTMNRKAVFGNDDVKVFSHNLKEQQSDDAILKLVSRLGDEPKVRWKDSIRDVIRRHLSEPRPRA